MVSASLQDQFRERMLSDLDKRAVEFEKELASFWAERAAKKNYVSSATIDFLRDRIVNELELRFSIVRDCMMQVLSSTSQNASFVSDLKSIALSRLEQQRKTLSTYFVEEQKKILRQLFSSLLQPDDPLKDLFRSLWTSLVQDVNDRVSAS